jgi:hypothetical protein
MKQQLTKAQKIMLADGLPKALLISQKERADWWDKHPPKPFRLIGGDDNDPQVIARRQMMEQLQQQQVLVRNNRFANLKAKKAREELDTTGMRWDATKARFVPDFFSQEYLKMPKWTITPYDANDAIIQRGLIQIGEGSGEVVVYAKMGMAFHRCPEGAVKKIVVSNGGGEVIRQWDETMAPLQKPTAEEKPATNGKGSDKSIKKAKAKGSKRAAKAVAAPKSSNSKSGKPSIPRGHGVIATVTECLTKAGKNGVTVDEVLAVLKKSFPDRDPEAMIKTVRIQMSRQETTKVKNEKRGVVYFAKGVKA